MSNPLSMPQMIDANGIRFGYHAMGDGPLVLLLHGFPDTAKAWEHVLSPVAQDGFRAVAVYMRGYSPTAVPQQDATTEDLATDVLALIEAFAAEQAVVVGHDWGAAAAYAATAADPARISKLITVALPHPAGFKPSATDVWRARHFLTFKRKSAPGKFVANDFAGLKKIYQRWSPEWDVSNEELADIKRCLSDPASRNAIFGYYRALQRQPGDLMRRKIEVPTLAFAGRADGAVPFDAFAEAASRFTGPYEVIEMPGGHFPHREDPDLFVDRLRDALRR